MGWLSILLSGLAAFLMFKTNHMVFMVFSIVSAIVCFWSWGVMHNYATHLAKLRSKYSGDFYDITDQEAEAVPDWITMVNMLSTLCGLILLVIGIIFWIRMK